MIDTHAANQFLNFGARLGEGRRADEQLEGAVAIHNILEREKVAYLADEVGMGKTYVALGALALFRHYQPNFRLCVIAPRENIQLKWMKELKNFVQHNVRFPDMRVKALDERPVRAAVKCDRITELAHEAGVDPDRDFFLRLTSFSLPVSGEEVVDPETARRLRDGMRKCLPWLDDRVFDGRNRHAFKDNIAKALCCALPPFDLVIVDEGHNLKHGFNERVAARNRVLALAFGHPKTDVDKTLFRGFGPRAKRVLFLSATPVEETYTQLWNQLDVFGRGSEFTVLCDVHAEEAQKKEAASRFLVRRVSSLRVGGNDLTKNLYRREWRRGGVDAHDHPITIDDPRQRLIVALVQKKVSEILGHERFSSSFQIGMLASFESFLETAKVARKDGDAPNFDDPDQTDDAEAREGIDVGNVNKLARSYREKFGTEMPHPKMDALVDRLADSWKRGEKALVFVRRVASVRELKRKLDERYDRWLIEKLERELSPEHRVQVRAQFDVYAKEKLASHGREAEVRATSGTGDQDSDVETPEGQSDGGGNDTFFAWFFRGERRLGMVSGATVQQRLSKGSAAYSTFFEENIVAEVLACPPHDVEETLGRVLRMEGKELREALRQESARFLPDVKKPTRSDRFEAVQAAGIKRLAETPGPTQEAARVAWHERYEGAVPVRASREAPDVGSWLELRTFFTDLKVRSGLCQRIWPDSRLDDARAAFRERRLRAQMLASAARLGQSIIDLYIIAMRRERSLDPESSEPSEYENDAIQDFLDLLQDQMEKPLSERSWGSFDELSDLADNFELLLDVNEPDVNRGPLTEAARKFGQLLGRQQPVGGMSGQVNKSLVSQFRMPGYPLALITTDLLQEGEDLHTFCSAVYHYGISWTPSSMEQRVGRVDRVLSQTDRRLTSVEDAPVPAQLLQVYFPHLEDTVEVLQVRRVLERINVFLRLMHEGLGQGVREERTIDTKVELLRGLGPVPQIREPLRSAFPVNDQDLVGATKELAVSPLSAAHLREWLCSIVSAELPRVTVEWEQQIGTTVLGTVMLDSGRRQPFQLRLRSVEDKPVVLCVSPVGSVRPGREYQRILQSVQSHPVRVGAIQTNEDREYDLTVEGDVLLRGDNAVDVQRVGMLIERVVEQADRLELEQLGDHVDQELTAFRGQLDEEGSNGG